MESSPLAQPPGANAVTAPENVLDDLTQAAAHARDVLAQARQQAQALADAQAQMAHLQTQLAGVQEVNAALAVRLQSSQQEAAQERARAEAHRSEALVQQAEAQATQAALEDHQAAAEDQQAQLEAQRRRNKQLEGIISDIHKTFFSGDVYALILKACLTITGASRGLYVTLRRKDAPLQIRAALDVDGYPQLPPSEFLKALCAKVLDDSETFVAHDEDAFSGLPAPSAPTERFHNCIAAPVTLLRDMNGIVICADKRDTRFSNEDVQSILAIGSQAVIAAENSHLRRQLQEAYLSTVSIMADAMEAKDADTQGHCEMVSRYAQLIARHLNLSDYERSVISYAALLHDIGKIGVSDGLLNKPGALQPEERELVRAHVRIGHDLIQHVPALRPVANAVLHHHECFDGSGYPQGLTGEDIPIAARVVCVVDAYSAMITRRAYKDAYSDEWARGELRRCAGSQFDPRVVDAFLYVLDLPDLDKLEDDEEAALEWLPGFTLSQAQGGIPQSV